MAPRITTQSDVKVVRLKPTRLTGLILSKIKITVPLRFRKAGRVWYGSARETH